MTVTDAPTSELGYAGGIAPTFGGVAGASGFYVDGFEVNADLRFPASTVVYDRMRSEDGQVGAQVRAVTLPILGAKRRLVGSDVRPEVMRLLEANLGLNEQPGRARRRRQGIILAEHVREALLSLWFGFMPFEQLYDVGPASAAYVDEFPDAKGRLFAHLRKLAPRMPRTVQEVRVARDGGLAGIIQAPSYGATDPRGVFIPVDRLVMYVNDREGADWTGRSVLRAAYKHWLIKDALIRLGAQIVERNGMGVPVATIDDPSKRARALAIVKAFRAGAEAGAVLEQGITLQILGVAGSTADELPRVKYHDEAIGRSALAMFLNLGHDNGARALGDTFVDYFVLALNSTAKGIAEVITEHVIRDLVELNFGPDEPYPVLEFDEITSEGTPTAEALKALADAGLITPDDTLEADVRRRYSLPLIDKGSRPAPPAVPAMGADVVVDAHPADPAPVQQPTPGGPVVVPAHTRQVPQRRTAAAEDEDLVDRLEFVVAQLAALRQGHGPSSYADQRALLDESLRDVPPYDA